MLSLCCSINDKTGEAHFDDDYASCSFCLLLLRGHCGIECRLLMSVDVRVARVCFWYRTEFEEQNLYLGLTSGFSLNVFLFGVIGCPVSSQRSQFCILI